MLSGGHYTGCGLLLYIKYYLYKLYYICEWWLYTGVGYILSITCINHYMYAEWWPLYRCGLLLYIKYYLYKLYYM